MDNGNQDGWQEAIANYYSELDYIRELLDPKKQLRESALLVENIIKTHFMRSDSEKSSLGTLLRLRRRFLGRQLFDNADFAVEMRNRVSHHTRREDPTDEQMEKATLILLEVVRKHVEEMESRGGSKRATTNTFQNAERTERPSPSPRFDTEVPPEAEEKKYATEIERNQRPLLDAIESDPHVTASTLAEYTFCPRAGILTHEGGYSDPEEELPSLALLPWYEQDAIEEAYTRALYVLFAMPVGLIALVVILSLFAIGHFLYPFLLIALLAGWAIVAWKAYLRWKELDARRHAALTAIKCDPVPGKSASQPVNWWGLLLAGYEVRRPEEALRDTRWKLSGKPRRILEKGSLRIPVHRIRNPEGPILPQHIVRVMAHCHLLEATEGANSPFGIVLFGNTYEGMTVPNTAEHRERFHTALERVRTMISESDAGERQPPEPVTGRVCSGCHFGHPRPAVLEDKTHRYDEELDPFLLHNGKKLFHCDCGDRFGWKPKHDANRKLRRVE